MTRNEKNQVIDQLTERLKNTPHFYITDVSTLTVESTNLLRRECHKNQVSMAMYKNSFIKKAIERSGKDCSGLTDVLKGSSSIMFCDVAGTPAKLIKNFRKKHDKPVLKGAFVEESVYIGDDQLNALASIKSKNELIGDIVMLLQSPAKNVIGALQSGKNKLAGIVKTLSEKEGNNPS